MKHRQLLFESIVGVVLGLLTCLTMIWMPNFDPGLGIVRMLVVVFGAVTLRSFLLQQRFSWRILWRQTAIIWVTIVVGFVVLMFILFESTPLIFDLSGDLPPRTIPFWSTHGEARQHMIVFVVSGWTGLGLSRCFGHHRPKVKVWWGMWWDVALGISLVVLFGWMLFVHRVTPATVFQPPNSLIYLPGTDSIVDAAIPSMQQTFAEQRLMTKQAFFVVPIDAQGQRQFATMMSVKEFYGSIEYGWVDRIDSIANGLLLYDRNHDLRVVISCSPVAGRPDLLLVTYGDR